MPRCRPPGPQPEKFGKKTIVSVHFGKQRRLSPRRGTSRGGFDRASRIEGEGARSPGRMRVAPGPWTNQRTTDRKPFGSNASRALGLCAEVDEEPTLESAVLDRPTWSPGLHASRCHEGCGGLVAFTAARIASGRSDPVAGGHGYPWKSEIFHVTHRHQFSQRHRKQLTQTNSASLRV